MKIIRKIFPVIFVFFLVNTGTGRNMDLNFQHLTLDDGLSSNSVYSVRIDSLGFFWFLTKNGLDRYDGRSIENMILFPKEPKRKREVTIIFKDSFGNFWLGGLECGLMKFNPYDLQLKNYFQNPDRPFNLSDNSITSIFEDHQNNLWVGTYLGGVNRYIRESDSFISYQYLTSDKGNINSNQINNFYEDKAKNLWIATNCCLYKYQPASESFEKSLKFTTKGKNYINDDIQIICEDPENVLWLQSCKGLIRFNTKSEQKQFFPLFNGGRDPTDETVNRRFYKDKEGNFWLPYKNILAKFNRQTQSYSSYKCNYLSLEKPPSGFFSEIFEDPFGKFWMASYSGLIFFNKIKNQFTDGREEISNFLSLTQGSIFNFYPDEAGNIWICSDNGVFKYNLKRKLINYLTVFENKETSPIQSKINVIDEDSEGCIWLATSKGLFEIDKNISLLKKVWSDPIKSNVFFLFIDSTDEIWASTTNNIIRYNKETQKITHLSKQFSKFFNNKTWAIFQFLEDHSGNIWFLTNNGLIQFNPNDQSFQQFIFTGTNDRLNILYRIIQEENDIYWITTNRNVIKFNIAKKKYEIFNKNKDERSSTVHSLYLDKNKYLWIGYSRGLSKFDTQKNIFIPLNISFKDSINLKNENISCIYEDSGGDIWIGCAGFLLKYQPSGDHFVKYAEPGKDIFNDRIYNLLEDKQGDIWILRKSGLSRFSKVQNHFTSYLNTSNFSEYKKFLIKDDGSILVGTVKGLFHFQPDSIINKKIPPVVFTEFSLFGKPFPLDSNITVKKKIVLDYDQNFFGFQFAALDFIAPEKNQYAYKLEGIDNNWIDNGTRQYARYSKVHPGNYIFRVKASNSDGYWNETGRSIDLVILPPWWQTTWAKIAYVLLTAFILLSFWRTQTNRIRIKHQLEIEKLQSEKLQEIDRVKSHFFANISHEFRTPLTLILGPLENLMAKTAEGKDKYELKLMYRSARRLYSLIGQLLDLSKLESGEMKLQAELTDVINFLKPMVVSFASWAEQKKITLKFQHPESLLHAYIDTEIMEKVTTNLLSNALKFTPEGGKVEVQLKTSREKSNDEDLSGHPSSGNPGKEHLIISVSDSGPGIPQDKIDIIFDRFYHGDNNAGGNLEGTGIGLALTKELVERHYGKITVKSDSGKGSIFSVWLPLGKDHLKPIEIIEKQTRNVEFFNWPEASSLLPLSSADQDVKEEEGKPVVRAKKDKRKKKTSPSILIVEDNPDLRVYMANYLDDEYAVFTASDGTEGFEISVELLPHLIISDIMMPDMDGFELCRKIKTDERTAHIPVILLTARADGESKLHGLETGADDYVTKPFDVKELRVRAKNLIEQRRKLRERFGRELTIQPCEITVNSMDEQFLKRALEIAEIHISNPEFTTSEFSKEIGVSRQHLNNKLKALTDQSTREFLRTLRLKRAAQLFSQQAGNITEIAYEVGFNNLSHFAKIFKEQFGISPSEFMNSRKNSKPS